MKHQFLSLLSWAMIAGCAFLYSCEKKPNPVTPSKQMILKLKFKQYNLPNYVGPAPLWDPKTVMLMPNVAIWDYAAQKANGKNALQYNIQEIRSDGSRSLFSNSEDAVVSGGQISIKVPKTGKFEVNLTYATTCRNALQNTAYGKTAMLHEIYDNHLESQSYSSQGDTIRLFMSAQSEGYHVDVENYMWHACGVN
jgi:hypothetical protein